MVGLWYELVYGEELSLSIVLSKDLLGCILRFGMDKHCPLDVKFPNLNLGYL